MNRAPTRAEIDAAELRCANSGVAVLDGLHRARAKFGVKLARTSKVVMISGASVAGLFMLWGLMRPKAAKPVVKALPSAEHRPVVPVASTSGLVLAFLARYGAQIFHFLQQQAAFAQQRRIAQAEAKVAGAIDQADSNGQPS